MGLFSRKKKEIMEEVVEDTWDSSEEYSEDPMIFPEDFVVSAAYGGINYEDGPDEGIEVDLDHNCFRSIRDLDIIYPLNNMDAYSLLIARKSGGVFMEIEDIDHANNVGYLAVQLKVLDEYGMSKNVAACFYDPIMESGPAVFSDAVERMEEFIRFLEHRGVERH